MPHAPLSPFRLSRWPSDARLPKGIDLNAPMSKELVDNMKSLSDKPAT